MSWENYFIHHEELCGSLSPLQKSHLQQYYQELISWNERLNLTRILSLEDSLLKHFLDSSLLLFQWQGEFPGEVPASYLDFGTGGGVPGVILWHYFHKNPDLHLMDARNKKLLAIHSMFESQGWNPPTLHHLNLKPSKAKSFVKNLGFKFDLVSARAVAKTEVLLETLLPLTKKCLLLPKGPGLEQQEWENAVELSSRKGFRAVRQEKSIAFEGETIHRNLLCFLKN